MTRAALLRPAVHRIACAIVTAEMRRLDHRGGPAPRAETWSEATPIGDAGLGLDSLERLGALAALAETFDLDDAQLDRDPPATVGAWIDWIMRGIERADSRLIIRTSGSTGNPQPCAHAIDDLLGEAEYFATVFPDIRRVISLVPACHLYGIVWTALLPAVLGSPVITAALGTPLALEPGDMIVAVPDQWQILSRLSRSFPPNVIGISSAGPLGTGLASDLITAGLARLTDVYGSSETGAIALRDIPATAYDLLPRWRLVDDGQGDWSLRDVDGADHGLPDHIERIDERRLRPTGRRDGAVQVGGHNVSPQHVAAVLRTVDGVADTAVRLHSDGRLKAFVMPQGHCDEAALRDAIERVAKSRLSDAEQPKSWRFGTALPRNELGKLKDWA